MLKIQKLIEKLPENFEQIICRLFQVLTQFMFTTSETEVDYYHQKVNAEVLYNEFLNKLRTRISAMEISIHRLCRCVQDPKN